MISSLNPDKRTARLAGAMYLSLILCGFFYLRYVPSKLIDWNHPAATVNNIVASETLYRFGIVVALTGYTLFLLMPFVLYRLLSPVNKSFATFMVVLAAVSVPISLVNMLNQFAILNLISKANYLSQFRTEEIQAQVMLRLDSYRSGNLLASIFWGLWLFPFGYLVYKSGFLPKIIGILLMIGCFGYTFNFVGRFLIPGYGESGIGSYITIPGSLGELGICLWLLVMGVGTPKQTA